MIRAKSANTFSVKQTVCINSSFSAHTTMTTSIFDDVVNRRLSPIAVRARLFSAASV